MEIIIPILIIFSLTSFIVWRWVEGIDYMHKNHPDYKGDDLFGEDDTTKYNK